MIEDLLLDELLSEDRRFTLTYRGHTIVAAITEPAMPYSSIQVRLFLDNRRVAKSAAFSTTRIPVTMAETSGPRQVEVKVDISLLGAVKSCSLLDENSEHPMSEL